MIISPSILALDYACMQDQMEALKKSKAEWLHFDVMDGHFVPNLTFGTAILKGFKKVLSEMCMDVHLMVEQPALFAKAFKEAGADCITFHLEALHGDINQAVQLAKQIRSWGCKVGISIRPKTDCQPILEVLKYFDLVLIMSVEPGFGGQTFMETSLKKIQTIRKEIDKQHVSTLIEVDGGINFETAQRARKAGCEVFVAGAYIFQDDIQDRIESLLCAN